jgi:uncharacterized membrane protein
MNKVTAVFSVPDVLKQGKMVADPVAWKRGQITASVLSALLITILNMGRVFGYELPISDEQINIISAGIVTLVGLFVVPVATVASTDKIGFKPKN